MKCKLSRAAEQELIRYGLQCYFNDMIVHREKRKYTKKSEPKKNSKMSRIMKASWKKRKAMENK